MAGMQRYYPPWPSLLMSYQEFNLIVYNTNLKLLTADLVYYYVICLKDGDNTIPTLTISDTVIPITNYYRSTHDHDVLDVA